MTGRVPDAITYLKVRPETAPDTNEDTGQFLYRLSHPLGEHVIGVAKARCRRDGSFDLRCDEPSRRLHVVEALRGKSGYLTLNRQVIDSYETEDICSFQASTTKAITLDQETLEKLFHCPATGQNRRHGPRSVNSRLAARSNATPRRLSANRWKPTTSISGRPARSWSNGRKTWSSPPKSLARYKERIKVLQREARQATSLADQHRLQEDIQKLEKQKHGDNARTSSRWNVRDHGQTRRPDRHPGNNAWRSEPSSETLFTIRWSVT